MTAALPRAVCSVCRRPAIVCYCRHVTKHTTRTRVVILQHPRERDVPINTARIASLCLPGAELHVGVHWPASLALSHPTRPAALLYPGAGAIDVEQFPPAQPITLVVVDGTWWQARKLVRANPALAALPRYGFRPPSPSDYRIRKEPREEYVSTIEALVHVLGVLEGDRQRFLPMLLPFRAMVDAQLAFVGRSRVPRHVRRQQRALSPRARLSPVLCERALNLVCVHAEANAWPYDSRERSEHPDELVQWVACRMATGDTFDAFVAPRRALCPSTPRHLGVHGEDLLRGLTTDALLERWARFVRPDDVVCTWGHYGASLFVAAGGALPPTRLDLRREARMFAAGKVGTLGSFRARLAVEDPPLQARGRAGGRLADLVAIASFFAGSPGDEAAPPLTKPC